MLHLDLFSGIGGFALAAERVWPNVEHVFCEIDPFCRAILKKHWPNSYIYEDIRTLTNTRRAPTGASECGGNETGTSEEPARCDLLTGGFPCQPFSAAGKRKGTNDDRHLWPEMRRVIQEFSPHYVVAENVRGLLSIEGGMVFETVCTDLEALGYEVQPVVVPACAVGAPHRRDRVWVVAYKHGEQLSGGATERTQNDAWDEPWPQVATRLCRMDDGLSEGVSRPRGWRNAALKAYGNAIVPQVAEQIFRAISLTPSPPQQAGE